MVEIRMDEIVLTIDMPVAEWQALVGEDQLKLLRQRMESLFLDIASLRSTGRLPAETSPETFQ